VAADAGQPLQPFSVAFDPARLHSAFSGKHSMTKRIVRLEGNLWRVRSEQGELDAAEQQELRDYFDEIRMPYRIDHGGPCVLGSISWEALFERLEHFYNGRAEVYPF